MSKPTIAVGCFQHPDMKNEIEGWRESLKKTTYSDYVPLTYTGPETVAPKRNILIDQCKEKGIQYLCFLDSDARVIDPDWLTIISQSINEEFGAVCPLEIKAEDELSQWNENRYAWLSNKGNLEVETLTWVGAYCFLMDLSSGVRFDEDCPGSKGMEDVIACVELWRAGRKVFLDNRTAVYHPFRPHNAESKTQELIWMEQQMEYIKNKLGVDFWSQQTQDQLWKSVLLDKYQEPQPATA